MFSEPSDWHIELIMVNDTLKEQCINYKLTDIANGKTVLASTGFAEANSACTVERLPYTMGESNFFLIEWEYDGKLCKNHYLAANPPYDLKTVLLWLEKAGLNAFEINNEMKLQKYPA